MRLNILKFLEDINMGIYKNDYTKEEDEVLWELHEIRHKLHEENKAKSIEEINRESLKFMEDRKTRKKNSVTNAV